MDDKLALKIFNVMEETKAIEKDQTVGKGNNQYEAVSESSVLNEIKPLFRKHKLIMFPHKTKAVEIQHSYPDPYDKNKTKLKSLTQLVMTFLLVDAETGESVEVEVCGNGYDALDKGAGKASTYAYKIALQKTFMLFSGEDTDNHHTQDSLNSQSDTKEERKVTTQMLIDMAAKVGVDEAKLCKSGNVSEVKYISQEKKQQWYDAYKAKVDKEG